MKILTTVEVLMIVGFVYLITFFLKLNRIVMGIFLLILAGQQYYLQKKNTKLGVKKKTQ